REDHDVIEGERTRHQDRHGFLRERRSLAAAAPAVNRVEAHGRLPEMRIAERFATGRPVYSFEFFPPRTEAGFDALFETIRDLKPLDPDFVSVTWGAGGSTRRKTV